MNDWEITLVAEAQRGNSKCFEELYGLYHKKVFAVIRTTVKNSADAEDILQQTFLSAWRGLKSLSNPAAFNTWIQRIAINHCNELLRKKNMAILLDSEEELDAIGEDTADELLPSVYYEQEDLRVRLGKILDGLSEVQRQTITLFYFNELKVEEIAEIMGCNVNTVKTRLFLARKAIRSEIEEQERKSGQKFYGIAGIPMLPLAQILAKQFEAASLSPAASGSILESVAQTIAGEAVVAAQTAATASSAASTASAASSAGAGATAATTAAVKAGLPLAAKIIAGVVAAGIVVSGAVFLPKIINPPMETPVPIASVAPSPNSPAPETTPDIEEQELDVYLTAEQLAFLETLEAAVLAYDMERAFPLLQSAEFHEIFRNLLEENGNTYKLDDNGEWMLAYGSDENGHETFEIDLVTSWENGHVYLAEASVTDGVTTYAHMVTFDVVDGEVRHGETYNGIDVHVENGVVTIERRDESGAQ